MHRAVGEQLDAAQAPQIEDHAASDRRGADVAVAARADADGDVPRARDLQARRQVAGVERQRDGRGVHVVVARVVDGRGARVGGRAGQQHGTAHGRPERGQRPRRPAQPRQGDCAHTGADEYLRARESRHGGHSGRRILRRMTGVAALEDVCERAWPPGERLELDGAVLRFTHGFTRRANSARIDGGGGDLEGLITRAEHEYRSRGLRPGFRLTPLTPPTFETLLSERGYVVDTEAVVMVAEALPEVHAGPGDGVSLRPELDEEWLRVFQAVERRWPPEQDPGARWVLGSGDSPRRFALARVDGVPAATGYGRLEGEWLYIACVATFPEQRRRGLARVVSERLLAWGTAGGAERAILQVEAKNAQRRAFMRSSDSLRATSIATLSPGTD